MASEPDPSESRTQRHKCPACYKQFKRKLHLIEHMKISYHSVHQPRCGVCQKHCKSFESVREHISGNKDRALYRISCYYVRFNYGCKAQWVCLVDEDENLIFHTYVRPQIPVSNYRYEVNGVTEDHLRDAMPLNEVQDKILKILHNGESVGRIRLDGGKGRLLVGHGIQHDLDCLRMKYPGQLLRDTAKYRPLVKTNLLSHSLKHLTKTYLGYDIQSGIHDPYEDCISVMRLYKRMRGQDHQVEGLGNEKANSGFDSIRSTELEKLTPDELYEISISDYKCWCLDLSKECSLGS
ncbi:RNA exonuclease 4 isoform X4 [Herrania umbratica]|uniref:RNA exonuclease 4 isoform X4 n=1 Tax=Herrania umbratica TaxID=108875 RepID=A0A6J1A0E5_9ROSI|nr:RNA exonuclease 4 isoform X4 [Herrania umbratica]